MCTIVHGHLVAQQKKRSGFLIFARRHGKTCLRYNSYHTTCTTVMLVPINLEHCTLLSRLSQRHPLATQSMMALISTKKKLAKQIRQTSEKQSAKRQIKRKPPLTRGEERVQNNIWRKHTKRVGKAEQLWSTTYTN